MYPVLAERIYSSKCKLASGAAPEGMSVSDVFRMATSGEYIPIDMAITIRDVYFPLEPLESLFERDDGSGALSVAEAGRIMRHTLPGMVMPEMANAVYQHTIAAVGPLRMDRYVLLAMGWCLAIGRAAGVREERTRRKEHKAPTVTPPEGKPEAEHHTAVSKEACLRHIIELAGQIKSEETLRRIYYLVQRLWVKETK